MIAEAVEISGAESLSSASLILWVALPYVCVATLIVGLIWRHRYDKFGWTTRSSQFYGGRVMSIASPLFHFGIIAVIMGHILGLLVPDSWTEAIGINEHTYHTYTVPLSLAAGAATVIGVAMLIYRRRTTATVFNRTTTNDKVMYLFLGSAVLLGITASWYAAGVIGEGHEYRHDVSIWLRSVLTFQPEPEHIASAPWAFQWHVIAGFVLFAVWPFTRLVHVFSAPFQYLTRPYVVYRSRGKRKTFGTGNREARRGWEPSRRN